MKELMSKIKSILILIAILIAFSFVFQYFSSNPLAKVKKQLSSNEALVVLENGTSKRYFAGEVVNNATVLDVVRISGETGKFNIETAGNKIAINGKTDWVFYLNNSLLDQSLDKYIVKQGDVVRIKEK